MSDPRPLAPAMQPTQHTVSLAVDEALLTAAHNELRERAEQDSNKCFGYFPGMKADASIDTQLPACEALINALPSVEVGGKTLACNFVRLSLVKQQGDFPFHLDTDAATALTGDIDTLDKRKVWRLLLNLSPDYTRRLSYINVDPNTVTLSSEGGYLHCVDQESVNHLIVSVDIPARKATHAQGVLFCSSRVLHTGVDDEHGHFVAGFGYEETE